MGKKRAHDAATSTVQPKTKKPRNDRAGPRLAAATNLPAMAHGPSPSPLPALPQSALPPDDEEFRIYDEDIAADDEDSMDGLEPHRDHSGFPEPKVIRNFTSKFTDSDLKLPRGRGTEEEKIKKLIPLGHENFYDTLKEKLIDARAGNKETRQELINMIVGYNKYDEVKKLVHAQVRVKAETRQGAVAGTGLDELFKTSKTMTFLEWSFDPPDDIDPTSTIRDGKKETEMDWMDAQRNVRVTTDAIVWAVDKIDGEVGGHTGTLHNKFKKRLIPLTPAAQDVVVGTCYPDVFLYCSGHARTLERRPANVPSGLRGALP